MSAWLVTDVDDTMRIGQACIVECETAEEAAAEGADWMAEEFNQEEPPHTLKVMPWPDPPFYRIKYSAERVPDEFQCCGGMPRMTRPGSDDAHTVPCPRPRDDDESAAS